VLTLHLPKAAEVKPRKIEIGKAWVRTGGGDSRRRHPPFRSSVESRVP
jgi:hypothetical protein